MNFRGFPPGCGDSVVDFRGWDAHDVAVPYTGRPPIGVMIPETV